MTEEEPGVISGFIDSKIGFYLKIFHAVGVWGELRDFISTEENSSCVSHLYDF